MVLEVYEHFSISCTLFHILVSSKQAPSVLIVVVVVAAVVDFRLPSQGRCPLSLLKISSRYFYTSGNCSTVAKCSYSVH